MTGHPLPAALSLFSRPTPVEAAPRLAQALGLSPDRLLLKRDDLMGLAGGGNKVRKLEVTLAQALAAGADTVVTTGAPQSNHARLTAAAAARCGLRCVLVLEGERPPRMRGNLLLDELLGAEVLFAGGRAAGDVAAQEAARRGAHLVPFGGTSPASAEAYRQAGEELLAQVPDLGLAVVAVGSGGTMAGLVAALGTARVLGVATGAVADARATVVGLVTAMGVSAVGLQVDDTHIGAGYDHLTSATRDALALAARTEGVVLDPTYTGRAMAGLVAAAAAGTLPVGRVVFVHTGGLPGLFGHPDLQGRRGGSRDASGGRRPPRTGRPEVGDVAAGAHVVPAAAGVRRAVVEGGPALGVGAHLQPPQPVGAVGEQQLDGDQGLEPRRAAGGRAVRRAAVRDETDGDR
ncbi:hypothetical protein GCM10028814_31090 [Angustibacter aerolatus]